MKLVDAGINSKVKYEIHDAHASDVIGRRRGGAPIRIRQQKAGKRKAEREIETYDVHERTDKTSSGKAADGWLAGLENSNRREVGSREESVRSVSGGGKGGSVGRLKWWCAGNLGGIGDCGRGGARGKMGDREVHSSEQGGSSHHGHHSHHHRDTHHERDRDKDRDRDRSRERDHEKERGGDRGRERNRGDREVVYGDRNGHGGHGHGVPSSIVRIVEGGVGFRKETAYEGDDADDDGYHRDHRYGSAGADTIFIANLPESVTEAGLSALLSEAGAIKVSKSGHPLVKLFRDKETGAHEAEVVLDDPRSATGIVNWFNGYEYKGSKILVSLVHAPLPAASPRFRDRRSSSYGVEYERDRDVPRRGRGYRGGRGRGRHQDRFGGPPHGPPLIGIGQSAPPFGRGFGGGFGAVDDFPAGGESFGRNNPNVTPREGDWICSEPTCGNLNFARRTHCNNCNKPRRDMVLGMGAGSGPHTNFRGPPPHAPFLTGGGPPIGHGIERGLGGFNGPVGAPWGRGGAPRDFDHGVPGGRPGDRFDHGGLPGRVADRMEFRPGRHLRDREDFRDRDEYRDRERFERPSFEGRGGFYDSGPRDRDREDRYRDKRSVERGDPRNERRFSPPSRARWGAGRDLRERSRSPVRSLSREYYNRRDDRRDDRRDRRDELY